MQCPFSMLADGFRRCLRQPLPPAPRVPPRQHYRYNSPAACTARTAGNPHAFNPRSPSPSPARPALQQITPVRKKIGQVERSPSPGVEDRNGRVGACVHHQHDFRKLELETEPCPQGQPTKKCHRKRTTNRFQRGGPMVAPSAVVRY